ncbi:MAG: large subunit ribosomal protein [Gaiellaceae bacterium]|jgi:large subunit ribosomal protein L25|nr:large subunit ribosomal protein [Gaiellaceae bacterium]
MAGERIKLQVKKRDELGTRVSRRLRKEGLIPGILYGRGKEPHAFSVPERELRRVLSGSHGMHAILDVTLEGTETTFPSILKDHQQDPMRGKLVHIDLQEVRLDQPIQATVTVELVGADNAPGVKEGGALSQVAREVNVEALPMEIPERIELHVDGMQIGDTLRLSDLPKQDGVTYLDDPETVLASLAMPTRVEEPEAAEGEELAEGEERPEGAVEGEAPPEGGADAGTGEQGEPGTVEG